MSFHSAAKWTIPCVVTYNVPINGFNKIARTKEAEGFFQYDYNAPDPEGFIINVLIDHCDNKEFERGRDFGWKGWWTKLTKYSIQYQVSLEIRGDATNWVCSYNAVRINSLNKGLSDKGMDSQLNKFI